MMVTTPHKQPHMKPLKRFVRWQLPVICLARSFAGFVNICWNVPVVEPHTVISTRLPNVAFRYSIARVKDC